MLSFILNSIQDTLHTPANLRRWDSKKEQACALCGWKNVGIIHILCGCKVGLELTGDTRKIFVSNIKTVDESYSARVLIGCKPIRLEQGRVSYRHDSILSIIANRIKQKTDSFTTPTELNTGLEPVKFVEAGQKGKKRKKPKLGLLHTEWCIQVDYRGKPVQFPPHIITTLDRPDIMIYSNASKMVLLIELTSPAEENIEKWREYNYKQSKYEKLAEHIREGGIWKVKILTVEIWARGFVAKQTGHVWRTLGFTEADNRKLTNVVSRVAIR